MKSTIYCIFTIVLIFSIQIVQAENLIKINELVQRFDDKYSIKIRFEEIPKASWDIKYRIAKPAHYHRLYNYLLLLHEEYNKYPKSFLRNTKLKEIALVYHLNIYNQYRAAVPDYYLERIYYDFSKSWNNKTYQRHVIHHEFFHMIEQEFNGDAFWFDPDWFRINPQNTFYGNGGMTHQGKNINYYEINNPSPGFINLYSKSGLEEDKAEIFAILFVKEEYKKISKWLKKDKYLNKKVEYMKNTLLQYDQDFKFY